MIASSARAAAGHLFSPPFRSVLWKSVGLTVLALILLWFGLTYAFDALALPALRDWLSSWPQVGSWLGFASAILAGLGFAIGLALLIGPVTALIAGLFLDDVAGAVEAADFPADPPGRPVPVLQSLALSAKFFGVTLVGNLIALALLLVPFVNIGAFFVVNGYLLGREYFQFAAMRFRPEAEAMAMRREYSGTIFMAGLVIAAFMAIPLVNLATPLFAGALMVHLHKRLSRRG
jgi:CysZ protein